MSILASSGALASITLTGAVRDHEAIFLSSPMRTGVGHRRTTQHQDATQHAPVCPGQYVADYGGASRGSASRSVNVKWPVYLRSERAERRPPWVHENKLEAAYLRAPARRCPALSFLLVSARILKIFMGALWLRASCRLDFAANANREGRTSSCDTADAPYSGPIIGRFMQGSDPADAT